jgi:hypothetical protein
MQRQERDPVVGARLVAADGRRIGRVEAAFVDYVLVRTAGLVPIDLYVPRPATTADGDRLTVDCTVAEARKRWHRPLKRAPHD